MSNKMNIGGMIRLGVILAAFSTVACVCLALVYTSTKGQIAINQTAKLNAALKEIFGDEASFEEIKDSPVSEVGGVSFGTAYAAKKGGQNSGIAITASGQGFNDVLTALVGVGGDGKIAGVRILKDTDTPGLGANAASATYFVDKPKNSLTFYGQFSGMAVDGAIKVTKDGGQVEAITAATITSRAVSLLVNTAGEAGKKWLASQGVK